MRPVYEKSGLINYECSFLNSGPITVFPILLAQVRIASQLNFWP